MTLLLPRGKMPNVNRFLPLKILAVATFLVSVSPAGAQTLLQDLDPGSVTEGAFADLFYYPEPKSENQYAPSNEVQPRQKSTSVRKTRSRR
jgi:hypothetical protein